MWLVKLSPFCDGFCVKNIKNLEEQDHSRSPTQTDCTERMTDLPGCACCRLNVLNVPGHSLGTLPVGAGGSVSWEWGKKNHCELLGERKEEKLNNFSLISSSLIPSTAIFILFAVLMHWKSMQNM
ncbi:hypothetical protein EK904_014031 [Melospiza melodia maxima]|nr:hypothetical protein EK904_014031 [Melospiza melodia maxima]